MKNIAIFASGSGTNFQAIVDAFKNDELQVDIKLLISDKPESYCIQRAVNEGIPTFAFRAKEFTSKTAYEEQILVELENANIDFIVLAGYMRLIGDVLLREYGGRIVNIHPSYLPAFPGKDAIGQALSAEVKQTGVTIHYVDEGMDTGPIIDQRKVAILPGDTKEALQNRIHEVEHQFYPEVLQKLLNENA
ncbi:phosphoribosylglycinamide formyltransferase [Cytobacillus kochii]|uniref:phosphoribosylglycinamide formyltransferase n=1 Tax=Cytobacillus kochii TaxID=859143 RepID=UPI001CD4B930|nr:phosphoribosylglycinamide formyltransferase [Cytobacillus kochii]MCA1029028.1 phosphoribosylglycinamide formyltransferase [Cytobacillus kochii]MCM3324455.1 phosphoribosylglycinamide formyltransferase [Cytobacillus kochii]MCM3346848.1 phosphoribosylglycinamide formyltransferase [Cytobacillus kochii]